MYIHRTTGNSITDYQYDSLKERGLKDQFRYVSDREHQKSQMVNNTTDVLGIGKAVEAVAVVPLLAVACVFSLFD